MYLKDSRITRTSMGIGRSGKHLFSLTIEPQYWYSKWQQTLLFLATKPCTQHDDCSPNHPNSVALWQWCVRHNDGRALHGYKPKTQPNRQCNPPDRRASSLHSLTIPCTVFATVEEAVGGSLLMTLCVIFGSTTVWIQQKPSNSYLLSYLLVIYWVVSLSYLLLVGAGLEA